MARELSEAERTVLRHVLSDHPLLQAQVDKAEVVRPRAPGSTSMDLHVPAGSPPCGDLPSPLSFPEPPTALPAVHRIGEHDGDTSGSA
ncbi:hypothetical protein ACRAKI_35740 [Saccharothrix isguenensis]